MRHFIHVIVLVVCIAFSTGRASADATSCIAAPDRACVFALAKEAALAEDDLGRLVSALGTLAAAEESLGSDEAQTTVQEILDIVASREPDPEQQFEALRRVYGLAEAPQAAAALAAAVGSIPIEDTRERTRAMVKLRAYAGDLPAIAELIAGFGPNDQFDLVLVAAEAFMEKGDYATAFELRRLATEGPILDRLAYRAVNQLLADGSPEGAEAVAAMIEDPGVRADTYASLALDLAGKGQPAAVRRLDALTETLAPHSSSDFLPLTRAMALLQIGERDRAVALVKAMPTVDYLSGDIFQFNATVALFDGDIDGLLQVLSQDEIMGDFWLYNALYCWLRSGQRDMEPVLARLSPDQTAMALRVWLDVLWQSEDWEAVEAVLDRYPGEAGEFDGDRVALALWRAENGDIMSGLAIVAERRDVRGLVAIAALLPN